MERGPSPVEHRMSRFQLLAGFGEQASRGHKVSIRAAGRPDGHIDQPAAAQRTGRPDPVARRLQHADRPAEIVQGRRIPAEIPQHKAAPVQHPSRQHASGQLDSTIKGGEAVRRTARVDQRYPQGCQHIGFTLHAGPTS